MSLVGDPGNFEIDISHGFRETINAIPDQFPVYKQGAIQAARFINALDQKRFNFDPLGLTPNPEVNQFILQLASSRFCGFIDVSSKAGLKKLNPFSPNPLPPWLEKIIKNFPQGDLRDLSVAKIDQLANRLISYTNTNSGVSWNSDVPTDVEVGFNFPGFSPIYQDRSLEIVDEAAYASKFYVDGKNLANWSKVELFLRQLAQEGLHPEDIKLSIHQQRLVCHYGHALRDARRIQALASGTGVILRGPAQDVNPIFIFPDGSFNTLDQSDRRNRGASNDESLDVKNTAGEYVRQVKNYHPEAFFQAWIKTTYLWKKNPCLPYMRTVIPITWDEEEVPTPQIRQTAEWLKTTIKQRSGLDTQNPEESIPLNL